LYDSSTHVLINPPIAVRSELVNGDHIVMDWLCSYTAEYFPQHHSLVDVSEASLMNPVFSAISDKPADDSGYRQICFHTTISAMDIPTLTFCFGSSLTMVGKTQSSGASFVSDPNFPFEYYSYKSPFCASAAYVSLYSLGVLDEERFVGHPDLLLPTKQYFNLTNTRPDFSQLYEVNLNATIDSQNVSVPPPPKPFEEGPHPPAKADDLSVLNAYRGDPNHYFAVQVMFANITLHTGTVSLGRHVIFASAGFLYYDHSYTYQLGPNRLANYYYTNKEAFYAWVPRIFTFFDGAAYERPGLRWSKRFLYEKEGHSPVTAWRGWDWDIEDREYTLESGNSSYTGYPLGLVLHARFVDIALDGLNNIHGTINAERNGSYAVFFGPFAAPTSTVLTHNDLIAARPNFSSLLIQQDFLDVIRVRLSKKKQCVRGEDEGYVVGKTTHIEQLNKAYNLSLSLDDYKFQFYLLGDRLQVKQQALFPDDLGYLPVGSPYENNYAYIPEGRGFNKTGQVGGSIFLSPLAVGWKKTFHGQGVDYTQYQTHQVFDMMDLDRPVFYYASRPTPRIQGLFGPLPVVKITEEV
jgi:hypothetical protein